jgi:hypothetical protein
MVHEFNEPSLLPSHSVLTSPTRLSPSIIPHKLRGIHPVGLASITLVRQRRGARMRAWQANDAGSRPLSKSRPPSLAGTMVVFSVAQEMS